jgi:hypothetical protein
VDTFVTFSCASNMDTKKTLFNAAKQLKDRARKLAKEKREATPLSGMRENEIADRKLRLAAAKLAKEVRAVELKNMEMRRNVKRLNKMNKMTLNEKTCEAKPNVLKPV